MEKISIIIPLYNGEKYITQTINNILNSTYVELEVIIINDGSTDNSLSLCEYLQKKDNRIVIYTKKNGGVVSARNYGLEKAKGKYICFCDQDDIVEPETYYRQVESINKTHSDFCICSTGRCIEGKKTVFEMSEDACFEGDEILKELLYPLLFNGYRVPIKMASTNRYPHIWSCMFQKKFIEKNGIRFRAYINYEDDLLVKVEALTKAIRISTISYVGYYWRVNLKSETYAHKYVVNIWAKQQKCYEDMFNCISSRIQDKNLLDLFTQITFCKQYLDALHNLTSPYVKKNMLFINKYYNYTIYGRNFKFCITARKYLKKGRIKSNIILPQLAGKMTLLSYYTEKFLDFLLLITLHSKTLSQIERSIKKKYL